MGGQRQGQWESEGRASRPRGVHLAGAAFPTCRPPVTVRPRGAAPFQKEGLCLGISSHLCLHSIVFHFELFPQLSQFIISNSDRAVGSKENVPFILLSPNSAWIHAYNAQ